MERRAPAFHLNWAANRISWRASKPSFQRGSEHTQICAGARRVELRCCRASFRKPSDFSQHTKTRHAASLAVQITLTRRASTHSTLFHHTRSFRGLFSLAAPPSHLFCTRAQTQTMCRAADAPSSVHRSSPSLSVQQVQPPQDSPSQSKATHNTQHTQHPPLPFGLISWSHRDAATCRAE